MTVERYVGMFFVQLVLEVWEAGEQVKGGGGRWCGGVVLSLVLRPPRKVATSGLPMFLLLLLALNLLEWRLSVYCIVLCRFCCPTDAGLGLCSVWKEIRRNTCFVWALHYVFSLFATAYSVSWDWMSVNILLGRQQVKGIETKNFS